LLKKVIHKALIALFTLSLMVGCASLRNSKVGHFYNNVTARYNGYFNAKELVKAAKIKTEEGHIDDYTQILKVFRWGSEQSGKALASDMDKAIEKCSEVIQKHDGSDWVDDAYTTVAMAYFYKGDYYAALDLFKYLASEYERTETESLARLWIVKCYIQIGKIEEAQAYLTNIQNERKKFEDYTTEIQLLNAELKIAANNTTEAINSLNKAIPNVKNRKDGFRYKFILAQLYEQQGNKKKAGELYSSLLNRNMPYEFQFQTRIKAAKCVNLNARGELDKIIKSFKKLLKDDNNREYFDQIYYEIGNIYLAAGAESEAIKNYKISAWIGEDNLTQKTNTYLALGDLFFKNNQFETAGAYYDSCATVVPEAHPQYETIIRQQSILGELILNLQTIRVQDSLLRLSEMPMADIKKVVRRAQAQDSLQIVKEKEREELQERRKELREENEGSSIANAPTSMNNNGGWYFENPVSIGKGAIDFKRIWGPRPLEDNWRRSQKAIVFNNDEGGDEDTVARTEGKDSIPDLVDPGLSEELTAQLQKISEDQRTYFANIPFLQAQKRASESKVIEALFNNGLIYFEKLQDIPSAIQSFETLLAKYPDSKFESAAHYYLFKLYEGQENAEKMAYHRGILENKFPDSQYAQLLNGNGIDAEKKNPMLERYYALAYSYFKAGKCDSVSSVALTAEKNTDQNYLRSKFDFLKLVCKGRSMPRDSFIFSLQGFITTYRKGDATNEAKNLMRYLALQEAEEAAANDTSSTTELKESNKAPALEKEYPFSKSQEGAFYFIMVVNDEKFNTQKVKSEIGNYNVQFHRSEALNVKSLVFDDGKQLFWVKTFQDINKAQKYHRGLVSDENFLPNARISSASMFYISTDNFKLLISDENTEDYIEFFDLYFVDKEN